MSMGGLLWIIIVGFVAGIIARFLSPGPNNPSGFILTTILGIVGAFLATLDRAGNRSLRPQPGRGLHHRHHRRAVGAVHLEQAGRERRAAGLQQVEPHRHCELTGPRERAAR